MIVLVGFMGAGKSTVGRRLAAELGLPFTDLDNEIESRLHRTVKEIFAVDGEAAFREAEHQTLADVMAGPKKVLAIGGGAAEHAGSQQLLIAAQVVYLQVGYDEALRRVGGDAGRPMLARPDLAQVYQRRLAAYESVATLTVPTGGRGTGAVCAEVLAGLARLSRASYPH
ncbi:MAG TPA: shikimate kinase [Streptosporangiaceae bacterium]|jgi:shikimate kinase